MNIIKNALIILLAAFVGFLITDNNKAWNRANENEIIARDALVSIGKIQSELKNTQARLEMTEKQCKIKLPTKPEKL